MSRITYVNGRYLRQGEASVSVEDRGLQFADSVYDVWEVRDGELVEDARHFDRLERSMREVSIRPPMARAALQIVLRELIRRNRVRDGMVYVQVTRGSARRDHAFPTPEVRATLIASARSLDRTKIEIRAQNGIAVMTMPDLRWGRPDIKSTALLPNVLARQAAREGGTQEAWLVDANGRVTEGAASNAWIVSPEKTVITRQADQSILSGVTRKWVMEILQEIGVGIEERPFTVDEAYGAAEAFITGATAHVTPVVKIDGRPVGRGAPGPLTLELRARMIK